MTIDQKLERDVAALGDLPRDELVALWEKTYGCRPPKGIKRGLLERSAAWHLQARRLTPPWSVSYCAPIDISGN